MLNVIMLSVVMLNVVMLNVVMLSVPPLTMEQNIFINQCSNANIYFYSETSGGQSLNLYLNVVHFFNTSDN
jgi:hypothetical protein